MKIHNLFRIALDFIYKKKTAYLLSIIIGIILCYFFDVTITSYDNSFYINEQIEKFFRKDTEKIYCVNYKDYANENYDKFYKELYNIDGMKEYGTFEDTTTVFWEKDVGYSPYFDIEGEEDDDEYQNNDTAEIDVYASCINLLNIVDINGKPLSAVHSGDAVPVYLGCEYKNSVPIGTRLRQSYTDDYVDIDTDLSTLEYKYIEYEVVGFIAENQYVLTSNVLDNADGMLKNLNRGKVVIKNDLKDSKSSVFFFTSDDAKKVISDIERLARKNCIIVDISTVSDIQDKMIDGSADDLKYNGMLLILIFLTALISLSFTSVMMLMIRKNEVGILYANGVTKRNMSVIIVIVNVICTYMAGVIAYLLRTLRLNNIYIQADELKDLAQLQTVRIDYVTWQIGILCTIIAIISSIITIMVINKYTINQLIGNNE